MHQNDRKRVPSRGLPMAVTQHLNTGLNFNQPLFWLAQVEPARQEKARDCLDMPAAKKSPGTKFGCAIKWQKGFPEILRLNSAKGKTL